MEGFRSIMSEEDEEEEGEEEEDMEDKELLPSKQIQKLREQNKLIWQLYNDAEEEERYQEGLPGWEKGMFERDLLSLKPASALGTRHLTRAEAEEEDDEEEFGEEEEDDLKDLLPREEDKREVREQNRIIQALYEDCLQEDAAPSTCYTGTTVTSETSGTPAAFPQHHLSTSSFPNTAASSAPSLATVDCAGGLEGVVEGLVEQEPTPHKALQINLALQQSFRGTIARVEEALKNNQQVMKKLKTTMENLGSRNAPRDSGSFGWSEAEGGEGPPLRYTHFCIPYFKDASGMSAPMNQDAKRKLEEGYLDLYTSRNRGWLAREHRRLEEVVLHKWKALCVRKGEERIRHLKRLIKTQQEEEDREEEEKKKQRNLEETDGGEEEEGVMGEKKTLRKRMLTKLRKEIDTVEDDLSGLKGTPPEELEPPHRSHALDWEEIAAEAFDGYRSSLECQLMWENVLHPYINHANWSEEEDQLIQKLVRMPGQNINWEAVAMRLHNNRTGYQVMQRWVSFLLPNLRPIKWGSRDTKNLMNAVNMLRTGEHIPWTQVHQHLPGYTRSQIYSRWRIINPESPHRHFSIEEDFILIKGLYLFGLNYISISHFLPGRTATQVRLRVKRTYMTCLATTPWTRQEDNILQQRGKVGARGWRLLVMDLPRRLPVHMRCRYLMLVVWHKLRGSDGKRSPPPLFPITLTRDQEEIKKIRFLIMQESSKLKEVVDASRVGMDTNQLLLELEEKRVALDERESDSRNKRIQRLITLKGRPRGTPNPPPGPPSLLCTMFDQFFAPSLITPEPEFTDFEDFLVTDEVGSHLSVLSDLLLFRPRHTWDTEQRTPTSDLGREDHNLLQELVKKQQEKQAGVGGGRGRGGAGRLADMPVFAPNCATVGAVLSMVVHLPVLTEMATGQFLFQNYTAEMLANMSPCQLSKIHVIQNDALRLTATRTQKSEGDTKSSTPASASVIASVPPQTQDQEAPQDNSGDESEEEDTSYDGQTLKIHITSERKRMKLRGRRMLANSSTTYVKGERSHGKDAPDSEGDTQPTTASTHQTTTTTAQATTATTQQPTTTAQVTTATTQQPTTTAQVTTATTQELTTTAQVTTAAQSTTATTQQLTTTATTQQPTTTAQATTAAQATPSTHDLSQHAPPPPSVALDSEGRHHTQEKDAQQQQHQQQQINEGEEEEGLAVARKKADELLFHRMLSMFYWPSIMSTAKPAWWRVAHVDNRMEMLRRTWHSEDLVEEKIRGTIIKKERVESETSDYIEEVARKLREDIERTKQLRQDALNTKPSQESQSDGGKRKRKRSPEPEEKGSLEAQEEAVQPPTEASPPPSPNPEEAGKAAAASDGLYHSSQIAMKKRKLTYLNRSILMKNLWKERREGTAQPRRQRLLIRREYQPRGSRTRNIKREDQAT